MASNFFLNFFEHPIVQVLNLELVFDFPYHIVSVCQNQNTGEACTFLPT
jgi:hypothetical protein